MKIRALARVRHWSRVRHCTCGTLYVPENHETTKEKLSGLLSMDKPSFTHNDLKQALQRIAKGTYSEVKMPQTKNLQEKEPSRSLCTTVEVVDFELSDELCKPRPSYASQPQKIENFPQIDQLQELLSEKDKQLELLKKTIKTLAQKKDTQGISDTLKNENQSLKEQNALLLLQLRKNEEETSDKQDLAQKLTLELSALKAEKVDNEKTEFEELIRLSNECASLKQENIALTKHVEQYQKEKESLSCVQEQRRQNIQQVCKTSDLEAKLSQASREKASLLARIQELSQKNNFLAKSKDEANKKLVDTEKTYADLKVALENINATNTQEQERAKLLEKENEELKTTVESLEKALSCLEQEKELHTQELKVTQACVIERQQKLEQEIKKHMALKTAHDTLQNDFEEIKNQKKLLEQHLARRIREASILAKQLNEQTLLLERTMAAKMHEIEQNAKLQTRTELLEHNHEEKRQEYLKKTQLLEEKIAKLQEKNEALTHEISHKNDELQLMKKLKERLKLLEKLYSQFGEVVLNPTGSSQHFLQNEDEPPQIPQRLLQ